MRIASYHYTGEGDYQKKEEAVARYRERKVPNGCNGHILLLDLPSII